MRRIRRGAKLVLTLLVVFSLSFSQADACRWLGMGARHSISCAPAPCYPVYCYPTEVHYPVEPCYVGEITYGEVISDCCATESSVVEGAADWAPTEERPVVEPSPADVAPLPRSTDREPLAEPDSRDDGGDLFGPEQEDDIEPSPRDQPEAEGGDLDLFGTEDAVPAEGDAPMPPDEVPAGDQPADDLDLFGAEPDEPAADAAPEEDVFDAFSEPEPAAPADDAPAEPADDAAPADEGGDLDDIFGSNRAIAPGSETVKTEPVSVKPVNRGMRTWTDNTGRYQTRARLVVISKDHVRLLKENGRHTTVSLTRLSDSDLSYVSAVAYKLTSGTTSRLASR